MSSASPQPQPSSKSKKSTGPTPMMAQYLRIKADHPDCLLLFRMGDFYETFYEDAKIVSRLLGLTLTSREKQGAAPIPLAGVPFHALDHYLARLLDAGQTVAICEQTEDPAQARGLVRREVVEVISPGTVTDPTLIKEAESPILMALCPREEPLDWGYALLDGSTGEFRCGQYAQADIGSLGRRYRVAEVLWPAQFENQISSLSFEIGLDAAKSTVVSNLLFEEDVAARSLGDHFGVQGVEGLGLADLSAATRAAGAALRYLADRQRSRPAQVRELGVEHPEGSLFLDRDTVAHLELFEGLRAGDRTTSLFHHLDATRTPMGRRRLANWLRSPLCQLDSIQSRLDAVQWLCERAPRREALQNTLDGIGDLERIAGRIATHRVLPHQLAALREGLHRLPALLEEMGEEAPPLLRDLNERAPRVEPLVDLLERAIVAAPPTHLRQGGVFRSGHDAELDRLCELDRGGKDWIARYQQAERDRLDIAGLKVGYNKVFGYHVEVTNKHLAKVPDDYEEKQRLTSGKRFVTAELKQRERSILHAQEERVQREQRLFEDLVRECAGFLEPLHSVLGAIARLDALASLAAVAIANRYVRPELDETGEIDVEGGRHPVVERLQDEPFTPNDLRLDAQRRILILTGPNMGGKSTYLRQAALTSVMAQMGSFVPASRARLGLLDRVFTRVGASDNLARGQSTFLVEMAETAKILRGSTSRSLLIFDEVGRGTSTSDGLALARAVIEHLHQEPPRPKTLFATHFHELTEVGERLPRAANIQMEVKEWQGQILFLHRVISGAGDQSYGVHVAELAGLPRAVLERARELLAETARRRDDLQVQAEVDPTQIPLFPAGRDPVADELRERLRGLRPEEIPPLEALQILAQLVSRARDEG